MTDTRKGRNEPDIDDLDFGDFSADAPPGAPPGGDFDFNMPDPHRSAPHKPAASAPEDDFADLGAFGEDPEPEPEPAPVAARGRPSAPAPEDFGIEELDESPRSRVALGKGPAQAPHAAFEADDEEEDAHASGHAAGFAPDAGFDDADAEAAEDEAAEDEEPEEERPGRGRLDVSKLIVPAGGAVAAAVIAFVGWSFVLSPMLGGDSAPVPQGPLTSVSQGASSGKPFGTGQTAAFDVKLPPLGASDPAGSPAGASSFPPSPAPAARPAPQPAPVAAPVPAAAQITNPAPASVAAMAKADPAVDARIAELEAKVRSLQAQAPAVPADVQQRLRELDTRLAAYEARAVPPAPRPEVQVPLKPQVIDGYTLQGVNRGVAWVQGPQGLVEVREGTDLGTAGKVTGIQKYNKDFLVVTTTCVIMRN